MNSCQLNKAEVLTTLKLQATYSASVCDQLLKVAALTNGMLNDHFFGQPRKLADAYIWQLSEVVQTLADFANSQLSHLNEKINQFNFPE